MHRRSYLRFAHEFEGNAREAELLLVDGLVPPVVENDVVFGVVGEWLLLVSKQQHDEGSEEPSGQPLIFWRKIAKTLPPQDPSERIWGGFRVLRSPRRRFRICTLT